MLTIYKLVQYFGGKNFSFRENETSDFSVPENSQGKPGMRVANHQETKTKDVLKGFLLRFEAKRICELNICKI